LGVIDQLRKPPPVQGEISQQQNFAAVPAFLLEKAAASPTWAGLVEAISAELAGWVADPTQTPAIQMVIGAPHCGVPEALTAWAKAQEWRLVEPPSIRQIKGGGEEWLRQFEHNQDMPLVIPRLEHLYLRHHDGLALLKGALGWLANRKGHSLIGINSWAYTYLNRVMEINALITQPLCPAACDSSHLRIWFQELASGAERFGFVFRQSNNGKFVLPPIGDPEADQGNGLTDYLEYLAAYSNGNPGVAWALWRQGLQYETDDSIDEKAQASAEAGHNRTIWVKSWSQLELPSLSGVLAQNQLFILHALLLHGSLSLNALALILPIETGEVTRILHRLQAAGLVETAGDRWQVPAPVYPAVRNALSLEGYLTDTF